MDKSLDLFDLIATSTKFESPIPIHFNLQEVSIFS